MLSSVYLCSGVRPASCRRPETLPAQTRSVYRITGTGDSAINDPAGRVSSIVSLVLRRSGIFFLLVFALLAQSAWGQRIGPLVLDNQQRSKASAVERTAAVARISFEKGAGSSYCSGTLLNNRRQDLTPYFLTAAHCVGTEEEPRSTTAFWFYQTQTCNGELPDFQSVPYTEGARLLSTTGFRELGDPEGDMTLLRLEGDLPDGVMFQGWDASPAVVRPRKKR